MSQLLKIWSDVYTLPFTWDMDSYFVYDKNGNLAFQLEHDSFTLCQALLKSINGEPPTERTSKIIHEHGMVKTEKGVDLIQIRGWGNLTGPGGMNLSDEDASNIQDTLADFIVSKLNQKV